MGKKVISFSLYNKIRKNILGAIVNCMLAPKIYPGWICRFYIDDTIPEYTEELLKSFEHVEVVKMPNHRGSEAMIWRFFPASDEDVDIMISRDADSWISSREVICVNQWLESGKSFHIIRDHCYHSQKIMGGVWGCLKGTFPQMRELGEKYSKNNTYDQGFLANEVYPHIVDSLFVHYGKGQKNNKGLPTDGYFPDGGVEIPDYDEIDEPVADLSFVEINSLNSFKCCHCGEVHRTFIGGIMEKYPERALNVIRNYIKDHDLKTPAGLGL